MAFIASAALLTLGIYCVAAGILRLGYSLMLRLSEFGVLRNGTNGQTLASYGVPVIVPDVKGDVDIRFQASLTIEGFNGPKHF